MLETTQLLAAVATSRRELEELFDLVPDLLLVVDEAGTIVRANRACAAAAGIPPDSLRRARLEDLISSDLLEWLLHQRDAEGGQRRRFAEPRLRGPYEMTLHVVSSEDGRTMRVLLGRRVQP